MVEVNRAFFDFLSLVDGEGKRDRDYILRVSSILLDARNGPVECELDFVGADADDIVINDDVVGRVTLKAFIARAVAKANANLAGTLAAQGQAVAGPGVGGAAGGGKYL